MTLSQIVDLIILISAVGLAAKNIIGFIKEPFIFGKKAKEKYTKKREKEIIAVMDQQLPDKFLAHDLETRKKYLSDRQRYLEEIKDAVYLDIKSTLEEIKQLNLEQNKSIEVLKQGTKDVLRQKIMAIYHQYKKEKRFPIHVREALDELYRDYKSEGGNSYIDKYYKRMADWEDYEEEY